MINYFQAKLLTETPAERKGELGAFLKKGHPRISWLHSIQQRDYQGASETLKSLAEDESDLLSRKKVPTTNKRYCVVIWTCLIVLYLRPC